jgi:ABC-type glycerol-3-phosphate transport system substrate-binding protein
MRAVRLSIFLIVSGAAACAGQTRTAVLTFSGSALGPEAEVVRRQLARFSEAHPDAQVELRVTPDAADQRHQLYVQWLNARAAVPDVLQLDVIWTAEFAAAGWVLPLDRFAPDVDDFLPAALEASRWRGTLYALPWFVDVSLLYWRTDLLDGPPRSLDELVQAARQSVDDGRARYGLLWSGARYEGLITVFLEYLGAHGGGILSEDGHVIVDQPAAIDALTFMCRAVAAGGVSPPSVLNWREEEVRLAFQNGTAVYMRNWPYAWPLLHASQSRVAGRVGISVFPGTKNRSVAALGGAQLAVNAHSEHPDLAWSLVRFLSAPEQMIERARLIAQLPPRRSLYESQALADALPFPIAPVRQALETASPRPVTPVYSELSEILQVRVHRALTGQQPPAAALRDAAREMRALLSRSGLDADNSAP